MDRLKLWGYKKLANENVKEEKVIDDADYNSCFQLKKNLKNCCKKLMKCEGKVTVEDAASVANEKKIIKKLREQENHKHTTARSQKSFYKCLNKFLRAEKSCPHQRLNEVNEENLKNYDEYMLSGIYEIFGNSCTESLQNNDTKAHEVEAEDLSSNSWYQSGLLGKFSLEMLKHQCPGSFIVHKASCKSNNFILSLRVPSKSSKVVHHLILQSKRGYRIKGAPKFFPTISSLVTHHSVMPEQLPITLIVQRNEECRKSNKDDDFSSIEDLKIVFTDLED